MFKNLNWKTALRRALEVFLAALLGGAGMYLGLNGESDQPIRNHEYVFAASPESIG